MAAQEATAQLYTIGETAKLLRVSEAHVYRLIASGALRAIDTALPGAKRTKHRVRPEDLDAYFRARASRPLRGRAAEHARA